MAGRYRVKVSGCDDATTVEIELTEPQTAAGRRLADAITQASEYTCQPRMTVEEIQQ